MSLPIRMRYTVLVHGLNRIDFRALMPSGRIPRQHGDNGNRDYPYNSHEDGLSRGLPQVNRFGVLE